MATGAGIGSSQLQRKVGPGNTHAVIEAPVDTHVITTRHMAIAAKVSITRTKLFALFINE